MNRPLYCAWCAGPLRPHAVVSNVFMPNMRRLLLSFDLLGGHWHCYE